MPRLTPYPVPKKRYHGSRWRIYWKWDTHQFSIATDYFDEKKGALVDADLRKISAALSEDEPAFPERYRDDPAVLRYVTLRYDIPEEEKAEEPPIDQTEILSRYLANLTTHCSKIWAKNSMAYIRNLDESVPNGFLTTTPAHATQYLESILESGNSAGTRNRALAACSRFFKWCKVKGHIEVNPFAGIKSLKEGDNGEMIVYCTVEERTRVLSVAESWDRPDWIAIPIALYAGCRREEVFKLQWEDVNFETRRMIIRESKTGQRLTPLSKELLTILTAHKKPRGLVVERLKDQTWQNQADRLVEMVKEHLCRPENPTLAGGASEAIGKRRFLKTQEDLLAVPSNLIKQGKEFRKNSKAGSAKKILHLAIHFAGQQGCPEKAHDGGDWIPAERIGWNAFRHTFATLRAQAGVSLDKITSWMGNTPDVCRKHYAQFMPRDSHDEDIDK